MMADLTAPSTPLPPRKVEYCDVAVGIKYGHEIIRLAVVLRLIRVRGGKWFEASEVVRPMTATPPFGMAATPTPML